MTYVKKLQEAYPQARFEFLEWVDYKTQEHAEYLDQDFRNTFLNRDNFSARLWELILCDIFIEQGIRLLPHPNGGPDFSFMDDSGRKIHIEAVATTTGVSQNQIGVIPENQAIQISGEVTDERLLRITSVLKSKKDKYGIYLEKGLVDSSDILVIAISGEKLDNFVAGPLGGGGLESVLYGIHNMIATLSGEKSFTTRQSILNANGEEVSVRFFCDENNAMISGVLYAQCVSTNRNYLDLYYGHNFKCDKSYSPHSIFNEKCKTYKEFSYKQTTAGERFYFINPNNPPGRN